ncbi:MAG TPA: redoxin domain-containing protein [Tepidisphaeraceae bacterium]|jgi:peroxiredoxin|nr:redoxin domain-containing protein [Tepidisphaeraceae bacterium]
MTRPFLFILILLCGATPLTHAAPPPATQPTIDAKLLSTQAPTPGIKIHWESDGDLKGTAVTDAAGQITLPNLPDSITYLAASAKADGIVPLGIYWNKSPATPTPAHFTFFIEPASRISGHVVDDAGKPIPDAPVFIQVHKKYPGSDQHVDLNWHSTTTDAQGLWSFNGIPVQADVKLGTYSLLHLTSEFFDTSPFTPVQSLFDGTAQLTLPAATPIDVTILKPDGSPAAGARLFVGSTNHVVNAFAPTTANSHGVVHLAAKPGFSTTLTASLDHFAPAQSQVAGASTPQQITLTLAPPQPRTLDVVDAAGNPIANATVSPNSWNRDEVFSDRLHTDRAGHATWNAGPADPILTRIEANGYMGKDNFPWLPNSPARVVLVRPTSIIARVVDAATGQPIPAYTIRPAVVWNEGERLLWQYNDFFDQALQKDPGQFKVKLVYPAAQYLLRVSADGHFPEDIGPFVPDGTAKTFDLRLQSAPQITGQVRTADDRPAANADVYLVTNSDLMTVENGTVRTDTGNSAPHTKTDSAGHFSLAPQKEDFALLVLSDDGTATLKRQALVAPETLIHLSPWAAAHGTLHVQGKPAANLMIYGNADSTTLADNKIVIARKYYFITNADGSFDIPRISAGPILLTRQIPNHSPSRIWFVTLGTLNIQPGQHADVTLGQGSAVTGQLLIPPGKPWMIRQSRLEPKSQPHQPGIENVEVLDDGHFRADGLTPGDYTLHIALHEFPPNNSCGYGRVVGEYDQSLTIPPATSTLDLGTLTPIPNTGSDLHVGDSVPDFSLTTLDGKSVHLSDLKGKLVLLDFWASWCAPCVAEIPNLKSLHDSLANDPRFVIASITLDDKPDDARSIIKFYNLPWPQLWAGPNSPTLQAYGATAIPATFLISPDGHLLSRDLRGPALQTAITSALKIIPSPTPDQSPHP